MPRTRARSGEERLVAWIRARARSTAGGVVLGAGDDAAILRVPRGALLVATSDMLVEGVDFTRATGSLADAGWKALAASLSDCYAMGARPLWALAALALPGPAPERDARQLLSGLLALGRRRGVALVGGDLSRIDGPLACDVTVIGASPRRPVLRAGARPGDGIALSGPLGLAHLGLARLARGERLAGSRGVARLLLRAQLRPDPDPAAAARLAPHASAMMDVSDGLALDLARLCRESRCGATIDESAIPLAPASAAPAAERVDAALHGGEDYRLLLTYRRDRAARVEAAGGVPIGVVERRPGLRIRRATGEVAPLPPRGHLHF